MRLSLVKIVEDILEQNPGEYFTARQIAKKIIKTRPKESQAKMSSSKLINNLNDLINQYASEIGARWADRKFSEHIKITDETPRRYCYSEVLNIQPRDKKVGLKTEELDNLFSYSKEDFLREVYISSEKYDTLRILLENKKNIILQGAPGVGKHLLQNALHILFWEKNKVNTLNVFNSIKVTVMKIL